MSTLVNRAGQVIADDYLAIAEADALPAGTPVLLPLSRWQLESGHLSPEDRFAAVHLPNTADAGKLDAALLQRPMLVLDFPAFADGRGYSQAVLLRRMGFTGLLRAAGAAVVADQAAMLLRCGFDQLQLRDDQNLSSFTATLKQQNLPFYQPGPIAPLGTGKKIFANSNQ